MRWFKRENKGPEDPHPNVAVGEVVVYPEKNGRWSLRSKRLGFPLSYRLPLRYELVRLTDVDYASVEDAVADAKHLAQKPKHTDMFLRSKT